MKIVQINSVPNGSTGNIMRNIAHVVRDIGGEAYTFSEAKKGMNAPLGHFYFGDPIENIFHRLYSVTTGISGTGSKKGTTELIQKITEINPDVIHLHNLHGWYINVPMLFDYIRESHIKTIWTLHDCWGFTAQCSHFVMEKCDKWKTGCYACPRYRIYPYTWVDRTRKMYQLKKEWLTGIEDMTIVTPSDWLADLVKQSFLKEYPVKVINNGINLSIFKPTPSDFREKNDLADQKIILGVASGWSYRKGLDVFIELSKRLDANSYRIVLVGTNDAVDKQLPKEIISIHRTQNQKELAEIYTAADIFVNPTREENYPTVNMEAIACGTPVVTFDTGGSKEMLNGDVGSFVPTGDVDALVQEIIRTCNTQLNPADFETMAANYDEKRRYRKYIDIYNEIVHNIYETI